jgi:hypothetical protein
MVKEINERGSRSRYCIVWEINERDIEATSDQFRRSSFLHEWGEANGKAHRLA